jgi:cystathionine beta-lyase/cystathionine gamma-synthase
VIVSDNAGMLPTVRQVLSRYQLAFSYVGADLQAVDRAFTPATRLLFVETPSNPIMRITDLARAAELAHRHNARLAVDNTFASPYIQRPIELGADLVTHSTTKYLNGHSDSIGGVVVATRDDDIEWLKFVQNAAGAILGPMDSWLVLRGTKTLPLRMAQHNANGLALAEFLHHESRTCTIQGSPPIRSTSWHGVRCADLAVCWRSSSARSTEPGDC